MSIARAVAARSDCHRDQVGAVVVQGNRIRSTGYNGAAAGYPGCESCPRRVGGTPPGSDYESGAGLCHAIHAEANALLYCDRGDLPGATLYVTREPCSACSKLIAAVGITDVIYPPKVDFDQYAAHVINYGSKRGTVTPPYTVPEWFNDPMERHLAMLEELAREMAKLTDF